MRLNETYRRKYCWHCNDYTVHEDSVCLDHSTDDELTEEEAHAEEDRRRNEDAQYRPVG